MIFRRLHGALSLAAIIVIMTACEPRTIDATVRNPCAISATVVMSSAPYRPQLSANAPGWNPYTITRVPPGGESTVPGAFILSRDRPEQYVYVQVGQGQPDIIDVAIPTTTDPDVPIAIDIPGGLCGQ